MEDTAIVALYWARDERAIAETAAKYGSYCHTIAHTILRQREDAQECVNDAYLAAWGAIPPHRPAVLRTFLGKLTRRAALKKWRDGHRDKRGGGQVPLALEELAECVPSPAAVEDAFLAVQLTQALNRFLAGLPAIQRQVFLRRYWYLESMEAIAAALGFTPAKVKSMLHRTRVKLLAHLKEEGLV